MNSFITSSPVLSNKSRFSRHVGTSKSTYRSKPQTELMLSSDPNITFGNFSTVKKILSDSKPPPFVPAQYIETGRGRKPEARVKPRLKSSNVPQPRFEEARISRSTGMLTSNKRDQKISTVLTWKSTIPDSPQTKFHSSLYIETLSKSNPDIKSKCRHGHTQRNIMSPTREDQNIPFLGATSYSPKIESHSNLTTHRSQFSPQQTPRVPTMTHSDVKLVSKPVTFCQDCNNHLTETDDSSNLLAGAYGVCLQCAENRRRKRELVIQLIREEISFGEELRCLQREVSDRMVKMGIITPAENYQIFGNLANLIENNGNLLALFREEVWKALQNGDQLYQTLQVGRYFNESHSMFLAYEVFCNSVNKKVENFVQLESQKESVKSFLKECQEQVQQFQNGLEIKHWLYKPLQRLIRYPVILECLKNVTSKNDSEWMNLKRAIARVNAFLQRIRTQNNPPFENTESLFIKDSPPQPITERRNSVDWPMLASRELESTSENTTLLMADFVGFERISVKSKILRRQRKYVAMLVLVSNFSEQYIHKSNKEAFMMVLKEISNNDFMKIRKLNVYDCSFFIDPERPLVLEVTEIRSSEVTTVKFISPETANEWVDECWKLSKVNAKWNRRRNGMPNIMMGIM